MKYTKNIVPTMKPLNVGSFVTSGITIQKPTLPVYVFEPEKKITSILTPSTSKEEVKELKKELQDLKLLTNIKTTVDTEPPKKEKSWAITDIEVVVDPIIKNYISKQDVKNISWTGFKKYVQDENIEEVLKLINDIRYNAYIASVFKSLKKENIDKLKNEEVPKDITTDDINASFLNYIESVESGKPTYAKYKKYLVKYEMTDLLKYANSEVEGDWFKERFTITLKDYNDKKKEKTVEGKGNGDDESHALWNTEIEKILKKKIKNDYVPVIASDETDELYKYVRRGMPDFSFVINRVPSTSDGSVGGHWRSVYINNNDDYQTAEFFDPLVSIPDASLLNAMKKICKIINPEKMFKIKVNMLKTQSDTTNDCGYHAVRFLELRNNHIPFGEATGYNEYIENTKPDYSIEGEGNVKPFIKTYNSFI